MSQVEHESGLDASIVWQQLGERIDALVAAWESSGPPASLAEFLPDEPGPLRRLALVEAIKVDMEYRWQPGREPKLVEAYLAEFPELAGDAGPPCDIIYEEFHVRRQHGDEVSGEQYLQRFPAKADELRRLFNLEGPAQTTSLGCAERVPVFEAGQQIDDFDLLKPLGKGAFASVFLARQRSMQRLVAVKISRDRGSEPQTLAQLEHPHIVRVFDQRQLPAAKLRILYMQYVPGGTLSDVVEQVRLVLPSARRGGTLLAAIDRILAGRDEPPPSDSLTRYRLQSMTWPQAVCWLGARLASALAYAHERGVLHRDVKPANVLVGADGQPKLADFNISFSKLDGASPAAYFGGSLAYMSPEQLEAFDPAQARKPEDLDARSDVYGLGVVLWELLVGRRPFVDDALKKDWPQALGQMTAARLAGVPPEARAQAGRECPPMIVKTLLRCLEPDRDRRYANAQELARELELCQQPRAYALLRGQGTWQALAKRHPVLTTITVGLIPNVLMCALNIFYNWFSILRDLSTEDQKLFVNFQLVGVNVVSYTIGLSYIFATRGKLFAVLIRLARGQPVEPSPSHELLRRCLTFGTAAALITALLWAVSGFIFPSWMQLGAGGSSQVTGNQYLQFIVSNFLCGMIAATQTYYLVTFLSLRLCLPWLVGARPGELSDIEDLADLARRGRIFLGLAFSVPVLTVTVLAVLNPDPRVIVLLGGFGLTGSGLAYWLEMAIRGDLAALAAALNPAAESLSGTDSMDAFLSGSRR